MVGTLSVSQAVDDAKGVPFGDLESSLLGRLSGGCRSDSGFELGIQGNPT